MKYLLVVCLFLFIACSTGSQKDSRNDREEDVQFSIRNYTLQIDPSISKVFLTGNDIICVLTNGEVNVFDSNYQHNNIAENMFHGFNVSEIELYKSGIICKLSNNSFVVLDSVYNRKPITEKALNRLKPLYGGKEYLDSIWFWDTRSVYYLSDDSTLKKVNREVFLKQHSLFEAKMLFEDSIYCVYGCGLGGYDGNFFFLDKKSKEVFLYPALGPAQVQKLNDQYYLFEGSRTTSIYKSVKNPSGLFKPQWITSSLKYLNKLNFCCNCDIADSLWHEVRGKDEEKKFAMSKGVDIYYDTNSLLTIVSFIYNSHLYSLQSTDSLYYIIRHDNNKVVCIDSFKHRPIESLNDRAYISEKNGKYLSWVQGGESSWDDSSKIETRATHERFVIIKGSKIDILEYYNKRVEKRKKPSWDN